MLIRRETTKDYDAVYDLVRDAFATAEHCDGNEQELVTALRKGKAFVPELSLVAEVDGRLEGHILFTEGKAGADTVLIVAPLSVSPDFQKQGIGSALLREGHRIAGELGYSYALLLGSEYYYPRLGYRPAEQFGITVPKGIPSANFMAFKLRADTKPVSGEVTFAEEFGI